MTDELKPVRCGCGGEAKVDKHTYYRALPTYGVRCHRCGQQTRHFYMTEAEAITAWNTAMGSTEKSSVVERTAKVETVEKPNVFKCSECGQYFHSTAWGSPVEYCSRCGCRLDWDEDIPMEYFESGGI